MGSLCQIFSGEMRQNSLQHFEMSHRFSLSPNQRLYGPGQCFGERNSLLCF